MWIVRLCFAGVTTELSFAFGVTGMFLGESLKEGSLGWVRDTRVFVSSRCISRELLGTWRSFRSCLYRAVKNQTVACINTGCLYGLKDNAKIILMSVCLKIYKYKNACLIAWAGSICVQMNAKNAPCFTIAELLTHISASYNSWRPLIHNDRKPKDVNSHSLPQIHQVALKVTPSFPDLTNTFRWSIRGAGGAVLLSLQCVTHINM